MFITKTFIIDDIVLRLTFSSFDGRGIGKGTLRIHSQENGSVNIFLYSVSNTSWTFSMRNNTKYGGRREVRQISVREGKRLILKYLTGS